MRPAALAAILAFAACSRSSKQPTTGGGTSSPCAEGTGCTAAGGDVGLCCGDRCVDITSDALNCGGCGNACPASSTCQGGICVVASCSGASSVLGCVEADGKTIGNCCNGACVDPSDFGVDPASCGACGLGCAVGASCSNASCQGPDGGSGSCATDADCPAGQSCSSVGTCAAASCAAAASGLSCTLPQPSSDGAGICCGSGCVDPQWDDRNCGGCAIACPAGSQCLYGSCAPAVQCSSKNTGATCLVASGEVGICCGNGCVDTNGDPQNCGGCATSCPVGAACQGGSCFFPDGGRAACTPPATGCPAGMLCGNGLCEPASCGGGNAFCFLGLQSYAGLCCGGSCVDTATDPANCGACGVTCQSGVCVPPGYSNAPSSGHTGLCLPPAATGSCTAAGGCPVGEVCVNDVCLESDCATLLTDLCSTLGGRAGACCLDSSTGVVCADLANDPANCGSCGTACPGGQSCANGVCSGSVAPCLAGRVNDGCNLGGSPVGLCCPGGGCSDPTNDAQNCGGCGLACAAGQKCVAAICQ